MPSHEAPQKLYLSLRVSERLVADLRRVAANESNTASAVAKRLISAGLYRELRSVDNNQDATR